MKLLTLLTLTTNDGIYVVKENTYPEDESLECPECDLRSHCTADCPLASFENCFGFHFERQIKP